MQVVRVMFGIALRFRSHHWVCRWPMSDEVAAQDGRSRAVASAGPGRGKTDGRTGRRRGRHFCPRRYARQLLLRRCISVGSRNSASTAIRMAIFDFRVDAGCVLGMLDAFILKTAVGIPVQQGKFRIHNTLQLLCPIPDRHPSGDGAGGQIVNRNTDFRRRYASRSRIWVHLC